MDEQSRINHVDEIWEVYLTTLDLYIEAHQKLASALSAGFITLAQANYASRTRFGQDHYDERMQATFTVRMESSGKAPETIPVYQNVKFVEYDQNQKRKEEGREERAKMDDEPETTKQDHLKDPIRMFGLFVPSQLRSAQKNFAEAVKIIVRISDLRRQLAELETSIRDLRNEAEIKPDLHLASRH